MDAQRAPAVRLEHLEIATRLRREQRREPERLAGDGQIRPAVHGHLHEDAVVPASFMELAGRVEETWAEPERACEPRRVANLSLQVREVPVNGVTRRDVTVERDVIAFPACAQVRGEPMCHARCTLRAGFLAQERRVSGSAENRQPRAAQGGFGSRELPRREQRFRLVLGLGDVRLVEGIDVQDRAHHRGRDLPAEEFRGQAVF